MWGAWWDRSELDLLRDRIDDAIGCGDRAEVAAALSAAKASPHRLNVGP